MNKNQAKIFEKLQTLDKLLGSSVQADELARIVKALLDSIKAFKTKMEADLNSKFSEKTNETKVMVGKIVDSSEARIDKMMSRYCSHDEMKTEMDNLKAEIIENIDVLKTEIPNFIHIEDQVRELGNVVMTNNKNDRIFKELESLKDELKKLIEEMNKKFTGVYSRGSGVTNLRIQQAFKYILKTEEPVGAINGVNTEYTLSQSIFAVLSFSLNGETIAQLPNYTISGKKITFSVALPADYSGKDFEVKYI